MKQKYAQSARAWQNTKAASRESTCELFEMQAEQAAFFFMESHFYLKNDVYSSLDIWKIFCHTDSIRY